MVRLAVLAALVTACFAAVPSAQAAVLGVDVQSTTAATLAKAPAVTNVVTTVTDAAQPVVRELRTGATTTAAPATTPTVGTAKGLSKPVVEQARTTAATVAEPQSNGSGSLDETASAAAQRPAHHRAVSFTRQDQGHTGPSAPPRGERAALGQPPASRSTHAAPAATDTKSAPQRPGTQSLPAAPDHAPPVTGGSGATAPAAGFAFGGGLALLAAAVCLAGPRLRRRLVIRLAALRPVAFVVLLERPG
jgi:hypothetical protein